MNDIVLRKTCAMVQAELLNFKLLAHDSVIEDLMQDGISQKEAADCVEQVLADLHVPCPECYPGQSSAASLDNYVEQTIEICS